MLTFLQFRVLSAAEGRVDFELDIHKDHTVRALRRIFNSFSLTSFRTDCRLFMAALSPV